MSGDDVIVAVGNNSTDLSGDDSDDRKFTLVIDTSVRNSTIVNSSDDDGYSLDNSGDNDVCKEDSKADSNNKTQLSTNNKPLSSSDNSFSFDLNVSANIVKTGTDFSIMDVNNISNIHNSTTTDMISLCMNHERYDAIYSRILLDSCTLEEINSLKHHAHHGDFMALSYLSLLHHIGTKYIAKDRLKSVECASQSTPWLMSRNDDKYCSYILGLFFFIGINKVFLQKILFKFIGLVNISILVKK